MYNSNDMNNRKLTSEEMTEIKKAASFQKLCFRVKNGVKSLFKNPYKFFVATVYVLVVLILWLQRQELIKLFDLKDGGLLSVIYYWWFTVGVPVIGALLFSALMTLFGTKIYWSKKAENAFISAGIYTKAGKAPWLADREKYMESPVFMVWEIYLNGNTKTDFEAKKENIQSELGVVIHDFKLKGQRTLLMFTTPDDVNINGINKDDMNF